MVTASQNQLQTKDPTEIVNKVPDPPVDISDFVKVTEDTHKKLQDLSVLCDKNELTLALRTWVISLNRILQKLHTKRYQELLKQQHQKKCPHSARNKPDLTPVCQNDSDGKLTSETEDGDKIDKQRASSVKDGPDLVEQLCDGAGGEQINPGDIKNTQLSNELDTQDIPKKQNRWRDNAETNQVLPDVTLNSVPSNVRDEHEDACTKCDQNKPTKTGITDNPDNPKSSVDYNIYGQIYVTDPFFLPPDIHVSAALLTDICFSSCCYGDISEYLRPDLGSIKSCDICDKCFIDDGGDMCDLDLQAIASEHSQVSVTACNNIENKWSLRNSNNNVDAIGTNVPVLKESEQKLNMTSYECSCVMENDVNSNIPEYKDFFQSNTDSAPMLSNSCQSVENVDPHLPKNDSLSISSDQSQSSSAVEPSTSSTDRPTLSKEDMPTHQFLSNQFHHQLPFAPPPLSDRCLFVQSYFHLLDIQKLRHVLYSEKEDCLDLWSTLIRCQQGMCFNQSNTCCQKG